MHLRWRLALIGLTLLVNGCAGTQIRQPAHTAASQALHLQHLAQINAIEQFEIEGRIGVQANGNGFSGSLRWQHQGDNDNISLYSPMGGQVASIQKTTQNITLTNSSGHQVSAADAETLTQTALGWKLPLTGLADWLLGRPTIGLIEESSWDESGHLISLKQLGWQIAYQDYALQNGQFLPNKIILMSDKVNLKLIIVQWHI